MALDPNSVERRLRKLRTVLKGFSELPDPAEVHALRSQARRLESIIDAVQLKKKNACNRVLSSIRPIRKAAGPVRDMDVLLSLAASLKRNGGDNCMIELLEFLAKRRAKAAKKLYRKIDSQRKRVRESLRKYSKQIKGCEEASRGTAIALQPVLFNSTASLRLEAGLGKWPQLTSENLHAYRLEIKRLHDILKIGKDADPAFVDALAKVKDQIGSWHDWMALHSIAKKVLRCGRECQLLDEIEQRMKAELVKALEATDAMRARFLRGKATRMRRV